MNILITGGTGSLGTALVKKFVGQNHNVTVLSRDSHKQATLKRTYPMVRFVLADICDYDAVYDACRGQRYVVHGAALKRVEACAASPLEATRVNINGTATVARAAMVADVEKALFISSDKSVAPTVFYGMTKAVGESIWLNHNNINSAFAALRYGNVLDSNGSVWHLWRQQIAQGKTITVRAPEPTRFIMVLDQAVQLVETVLGVLPLYGDGVFLPSNLPAFSLWDLAKTFAPRDQWQETDLLDNEKQHEVLLAPDECARQILPHLWCTCTRYNMTAVSRECFSSYTTPMRLTGPEVASFLERQR